MKIRRLSKPHKHIRCSSADPRVPDEMRGKQNKCVMCCARCNRPRSHGDDAMSYWDLFHKCDGLFNGPAATLCDIKNPQLELSTADKYMSNKVSKDGPKSIEKSAGKRTRTVAVQMRVQRKTR